MSMHNLSMVQALSLWTDLMDAFHAKNRYGGTTAELYMHRLMPRSPSAETARTQNRYDGYSGEARVEQITVANESLHSLLVHFAKEQEVHIEVEDRELGTWVKTAGFEHRVHVKVTRKTPADQSSSPE